ncbi:hypothetical protein DC498_10750 [Terrimonas sp.]|uniref:hypothetical protein n=1 Tax=Terrimonas sp. TaxID=1914338 RepID=UPI000D50AFC0|nr:hypothetical protein [Terrimonas sp.]PVD52194.1 hypothetical protein DC498_10750 [Terrimonas sp.]
MEKEKITLAIGSDKALVFEADPGSKSDMDFAKLCQKVATKKPQSLQEFFILLNEVQQKLPSEIYRKRGRKI